MHICFGVVNYKTKLEVVFRRKHDLVEAVLMVRRWLYKIKMIGLLLAGLIHEYSNNANLVRRPH
jgi:hypothetical protein